MISLVLANKGRPQLLKKFLQSVIDTVYSIDNIELVFGGNVGDDEANAIYFDFINKYPNIKHKEMFFKEPYLLNDKINYIADQATGDLIFGVANDLECKTMHWDKYIIDLFDSLPKDKIFVAWINDGANSEKLPRHYVIHKNYKLLTGNYSQKCLIHYYSDNWIYDVATGIDRYKYLEEIKFDHHSPVLEANIDENIKQEIISEMNYFMPIDQHTYVNTTRYRQYEEKLLLEFINNNKE